MKAERPRLQAGYTLTEALVVFAIIGVITMASVPAFMTMKHSNEMKVSLSSFTNDVRWARHEAVAGQRRVRISLKLRNLSATPPELGNTWTVTREEPGGAFTSDGLPPNHRGGRLQSGTYFETSSYTNVDSSADSSLDIVFVPSGNIDTSTGMCPAGNNTVVIKSEFNKIPHPTYTVTLTQVGQVKTS